MFKKDYQRSPQEKAQRAKMSIFARLAGCAYLIYIMVQLLKTPAEETPGTSWPIIVAIVLIVMAAAVVAITVYDLIRGLKVGLFNPATYEDQAAESFPCPDTDASDSSGALEQHAESADEPGAAPEDGSDENAESSADAEDDTADTSDSNKSDS